MPMTVNVLSGESLEVNGIQDSKDLQYKVPGLVFKTNTVLGQPYLRGIGSDIISVGSDASVATFIDGVYMTRATSSIQNFYDIERVEVSKGPQAVHLGRNVIGGAISIISKDPQRFNSAYVDLLTGSFNERQFQGAVNQYNPDSGLAYRLAGIIKKRDGYTENLYLDKDLDDENFYAWRGKLLYPISKDLDLLFTAEQTSEDSTRGLGFQPNPDVGINGGIIAGGTVPDDPRKVLHNVDESVEIKTNRYSAKVTAKLDNIDVLSMTSYQDTNGKVAIDLDATEVDFASNFAQESSRAIAQELRFSSKKDEPFGWIAGLFLLNETADQTLDIQLALFSVSRRPTGNVDTNSYAIFGEASYKIYNKWQTTAGIRYSYDRRGIDFTQTLNDPGGIFAPPGTSVITQNESKSWDAITPEFGVEYNANENTLYYGNISRGYKAGGYNTTALQPAFDPEYLLAYEVGLKIQPTNSIVRINGSLFYYDYKDIQLLTLLPGAAVGSFPVVVNAAAATTVGADLELLMNLIRNLQLSIGLTLLEAQLDNFVSIDPNNPTDDADQSGNPLPQAPDVSLNLGAEYSWRLNRIMMTSAISYRYQSNVYFNAFKDEAVKQKAYGIINASLLFNDFKSSWQARLFVNNITDELYAETIIRQDPIAGVLRSWGAPRTWGLGINYEF